MVRVWMYFYVSKGGMRNAHRLDTELYEHLPFSTRCSCPPVLLHCLESRVGDARVIVSWAHLTSHFTDGAGLAVRSVALQGHRRLPLVELSQPRSPLLHPRQPFRRPSPCALTSSRQCRPPKCVARWRVTVSGHRLTLWLDALVLAVDRRTLSVVQRRNAAAALTVRLVRSQRSFSTSSPRLSHSHGSVKWQRPVASPNVIVIAAVVNIHCFALLMHSSEREHQLLPRPPHQVSRPLGLWRSTQCSLESKCIC